VALKRGSFVAESSLWQPSGCGLEMPVGTCRGSGETGSGLAGGLLLVQLGRESAGSARCVRGRVDSLR
jgi:hypothetical protein